MAYIHTGSGGAITQHVVYRGQDARIHELYTLSNDWVANTLNFDSNAPLAAGNPFAYIHTGSGGAITQHVVYRAQDGHVYEIYTLDGKWVLNDLTGRANAPLAAGDPFAYTHGSGADLVQHVVYRGQDGHIHELYTLNNQWVVNTALTADTGAPPAAGDPFAYTHGSGAGLVQHVIYRGQDSHIYELYTHANSWVVNNLTNRPNAALAAGDPKAYLHDSPNGPVQHVVYRGHDGHIYELYTLGDWVVNNLTQQANAPLPAGDPFGYIHEGETTTQHVVYRGHDGNIYELFTLNNKWVFNDPSRDAKAPLAASDPFAYVHYSNKLATQHVVYRGQDDFVHELYTLNNKWVFNTITQAAITKMHS